MKANTDHLNTHCSVALNEVISEYLKPLELRITNGDVINGKGDLNRVQQRLLDQLKSDYNVIHKLCLTSDVLVYEYADVIKALLEDDNETLIKIKSKYE